MEELGPAYAFFVSDQVLYRSIPIPDLPELILSPSRMYEADDLRAIVPKKPFFWTGPGKRLAKIRKRLEVRRC